MAGLFDILNVSPAESVQPTLPVGLQGIAQTLAGVAGRGAQQAAGQDTRTTAAKLASAAKGVNPQDPASLRQMAQRLNDIGESQRAVGVLQMANDLDRQQVVAMDTKNAYSSVASALEAKGMGGLAKAVLANNPSAYERGLEVLGQTETSATGLQGVSPVGVFEDPDGNRYTASTVTTKQGATTNQITPIGNAPAYSDQDLTPLGGDFLENRGEVIAAGATTVELEGKTRDYVDLYSSAVTDLPATSDALVTLHRLRELNAAVETGGFTAQVAQAATDLFGVTPGDVGELNQLAKQRVIEGLASFTGAISEGERQYLENMQVSITNSEAVNDRIIDSSIEELRRRQSRQQRLIRGDSLDQYNEFILGQYDFLENTPDTVSWKDL